MKPRKVVVLSRTPDPDTLRFSVCVDGYIYSESLDWIKRAVADGATLTEQGWNGGTR